MEKLVRLPDGMKKVRGHVEDTLAFLRQYGVWRTDGQTSCDSVSAVCVASRGIMLILPKCRTRNAVHTIASFAAWIVLPFSLINVVGWKLQDQSAVSNKVPLDSSFWRQVYARLYFQFHFIFFPQSTFFQSLSTGTIFLGRHFSVALKVDACVVYRRNLVRKPTTSSAAAEKLRDAVYYLEMLVYA